MGPIRSLPEFIRRRRNELNLTQTDVAQAVGVQSPDFISLIEQGLRNLSLDRIPMLAQVLQVEAVELCKMALEQQFPLLADCLFSEQSIFRGPQQGSGAAQNLGTKLLSLIPDIRDPIIHMIDQHYTRRMSSQRTTKQEMASSRR